jgi:NAD(P)-dependent dehydrogenase (short-subunit alcohol dehydrogenase family)
VTTLADKIALITGAGSGIGKQAVNVCIREGAAVVAVDLNGSEKAMAAEFGDRVVPLHCDVARDERGFKADVENSSMPFGHHCLADGRVSPRDRTARKGQETDDE